MKRTTILLSSLAAVGLWLAASSLAAQSSASASKGSPPKRDSAPMAPGGGGMMGPGGAAAAGGMMGASGPVGVYGGGAEPGMGGPAMGGMGAVAPGAKATGRYGPTPDRGNLVLKVYHLRGAAPVASDYPYPGGNLPTSTPEQSPPRGEPMNIGLAIAEANEDAVGGSTTATMTMGPGGMGGGGGMMGGGMGVGMGGMGGAGGMAPGAGGSIGRSITTTVVSDSAGSAGKAARLAAAIQRVVAPETWDASGGPASCQPFGRSLLVLQTPEVHEQVARLLGEIDADESADAQTVLVEAYWLLLDSEKLASLVPGKDAGPIGVDEAALAAITLEPTSLRGRVACLNGQTVHLTSGDRRSVVMGAIPVVGSGAAYQPQMMNVNVGLLLQVTPSLLPGAKEAVLDVRNTVTGWRESPPVQIGAGGPASVSQGTSEPASWASISVDRPNLPTQQLATTLRVPVGRAVLVGGLTLDPNPSPAAEPAQGERKQLYLVVRISSAGP